MNIKLLFLVPSVNVSTYSQNLNNPEAIPNGFKTNSFDINHPKETRISNYSSLMQP